MLEIAVNGTNTDHHSSLQGPKSIGYETLLYDYQYLRPTNGSILPPLTQGLAEAILKDINIAKEIRRLPGISSSEKEDLIDRLGPDGTLIYPHGTSDEVIDKVQAVIQKYHDRKFAKFIIDFLNKILDRMINLGKKYGVSEYGIIERLQSRGNVIASFIGHAVKPPSQDGIVRSNIHGGGLNGEIVMWSEGLSLWMNLRLVSDDGPNDRRNVDTGDVKLFTLYVYLYLFIWQDVDRKFSPQELLRWKETDVLQPEFTRQRYHSFGPLHKICNRFLLR